MSSIIRFINKYNSNLLYLFKDFFINQSYLSKLYHSSIFFVIFYNYYIISEYEYKNIFLYNLLKTEISCIFYILKHIFQKKTYIYRVNITLYYLSFLKFRIYEFYHEIIYNNIYFDIFSKTYLMSNYFLYILLLCYFLYILNLYWFLIMNKILYKKITNIINIDTDLLCHNICSYLYFINIPLCFYMHNQNHMFISVFDIIGVVTLSITSYIYHYDIYSRLYHKKIKHYDIPNKENILYFLNDFLSINIRSFLSVVIIYYNNYYFFVVLFISIIYHLFFIYISILNIIELIIDYYKKKNIFSYYHNLLLFIPIICDLSLVCIISPIEITIPLSLLNIIIGLLFLVEPFYKLTHIAFHILLIFQTYYICLSSSK